MKHRLPSLAFLLIVLFFCVPDLRAQIPSGQRTDPRLIEVGHVQVRVRAANGAPLGVSAMVTITTLVTTLRITQSTQDGAQTVFRGLPLGEYQVEVSAMGYLTAHEEVSVIGPGAIMQVFVQLLPEGAPAISAKPAVPLLTMKARHELEKGLQALKANDPIEARKRLEAAYKLAPGHPDVNYLLGVTYMRLSRLSEAQKFLEQALSIQPDHVAAMNSLGGVLQMQGDYSGAVRVLEKALGFEPNSWKTHWIAASASYQGKEFENARIHAARALELSGGKAPEIQMLLGQALAALGKTEQAARELQVFIDGNPAHIESPAAKQLLAQLQSAMTDAARAKAAALATPVNASPIPSAPGAAAEPAGVGESWSPPDVDKEPPAVAKDVTCATSDVLKGASRSAMALVDNLQRFTAYERLERWDFGVEMVSDAPWVWTFEYIATVEQVRPGILVVDESRRPKGKLTTPPVNRLETTGLAAMALIFHPFYSGDYEMTCEGLGQWRGRAAWLVHFRQKESRANRFRVYTVAAGSFPVALKGRAWIGTGSFQVLRIETDLARPIEAIRLKREHLEIDYAPVDFVRKKTTLWLPAQVDLYADLRGQRSHYRHSFSRFLLFSVDTDQRVQQPKQ